MDKEFKLHYSGYFRGAIDGEVAKPTGSRTYGFIRSDGHRGVRYQGKEHQVHIIIAELYLNGNKPLPEGYDVHHINFNPEDNRVENLLIISHGEHRKLHMEGQLNPNYGKFGANHPKSKPIIGTNKTTGEVREFVSASEASNTLGIAIQSISACCLGKRKSAGGWLWEYKKNASDLYQRH